MQVLDKLEAYFRTSDLFHILKIPVLNFRGPNVSNGILQLW